MLSYRFVTVDVFTTQRFGGNPLAVFTDARGLTSGQMQAIAAEMNLSETTFVLPADDPANTARVRIFTPVAELPFAGHPNVGTGLVLAQMGRDHDGAMVFEEAAGLVSIRVARTGEAIETISIDAPQPLSLGDEYDPADVAACAGIDVADVITAAHAPVTASVGTWFLLAEVTADALGRAAPDVAAFRRVRDARPGRPGRGVGVMIYARDGDRLRSRMFAPLSNIPEDPATGSAATPLVALLLSLDGGDERVTDVIQGVEMGRPSLLHVRAWRAADGIRASVAGACVPVLRGEAEV